MCTSFEHKFWGSFGTTILEMSHFLVEIFLDGVQFLLKFRIHRFGINNGFVMKHLSETIHILGFGHNTNSCSTNTSYDLLMKEWSATYPGLWYFVVVMKEGILVFLKKSEIIYIFQISKKLRILWFRKSATPPPLGPGISTHDGWAFLC